MHMLDQVLAETVLNRAFSCGADFAEIFVEDKDELSVEHDGNAVAGVFKARIRGAGIYLLRDMRSVYVYTNDLSEGSLKSAVLQAGELLDLSVYSGLAQQFSPLSAPEPCPAARYPSSVGFNERAAVLACAAREARNASAFLQSVSLQLFETDQRVLIANTEGVWAEDRRAACRLRMVPVLADGKERVGFFNDYTHPRGFECFDDGGYPDWVSGRVRRMERMLSAAEAPATKVPVILDGGDCSGTFFHEACGHQLETTGMRRGESKLFEGRLGERIASEKVTVIDDGQIPGMYGSSKFDDEGMPRQENVLIENGILKSYLADRLGSRVMGVARTASGRRQGYAFAPGARMSNTYLAPGPDDHDEILNSMDEGLLVTMLGGGSGGDEFTLLAQEAYWVKNGRIDRQVKGAILLGRCDRTMLEIDRVGDRMMWDDGGAYCGAVSGLCHTTTSGARMRVKSMVVGGRGGM
jgi:TldD protein